MNADVVLTSHGKARAEWGIRLNGMLLPASLQPRSRTRKAALRWARLLSSLSGLSAQALREADERIAAVRDDHAAAWAEVFRQMAAVLEQEATA